MACPIPAGATSVGMLALVVYESKCRPMGAVAGIAVATSTKVTSSPMWKAISNAVTAVRKINSYLHRGNSYGIPHWQLEGEPMRRCSVCGGLHARGLKQPYCMKCHAAYMREWRKTHPPSAAERFRSNCRSYTRVLIKRGHLKVEPCEECGGPLVQAHHSDYTNPRLVTWLCTRHHIALHQRLRAQQQLIEEM